MNEERVKVYCPMKKVYCSEGEYCKDYPTCTYNSEYILKNVPQKKKNELLKKY